MSYVVELDGSTDAGRKAPIFETLRSGKVVVYRQLPEILALRQEILRIADPCFADDVNNLLETSKVPDYRVLASLYNACFAIRDRHLLGDLFAGLISGLDLPRPLLPDAGYFRMVTPYMWDDTRAHPEWFHPDEYSGQHPNEPEKFCGGMCWGSPHRDIDFRHAHFQVNFWFPLHDIGTERTLLIYPEVYHRDVPQYVQDLPPDSPEKWGYGTPVQVALKAGDALLFHSQQLHASPGQGRELNRFTCEFRLAAGCEDDNTRVYRRMYSREENAGKPRAAFYSLFGLDHWSAFQTHYVRREDAVLRKTRSLTLKDFEVAWGDIRQGAEDLKIAFARILALSSLGTADLILNEMAMTSQSYFWTMDASVLLMKHGRLDLASNGLERVIALAKNSPVALDRYGGSRAKPRNDGSLQLLPDGATNMANQLLGYFKQIKDLDHRA